MASRSLISRRAVLAAPLAALSCSPPKADGFLGYCFVANQVSRTVSVVDLYRRFRVIKQIALDAAPSLVLRHPTKTKMFVLTPDSGTVQEIDGANLSVARRVSAGNSAVSMQLSPRGDALWVLYRDPASLVEISLDSLKPARRVRLEGIPTAFALNTPAPNRPAFRAVVIGKDSPNITVASLDGSRVERVIGTGGTPSLVLFRNDGQQIMAGCAERYLAIFETATGKTVVRLPLPLAPRNYTTSSDGGQLFISGDGMDGVVVVFPYTTQIWQTVLAGRAPGAMMSVDNPQGRLMVANPQNGSLTVLDVNDQKLVAVVQVGQEPCQILTTPATNPQQQYILVVDRQSGDLAVIRNYSLNSPTLGSKPWLKSAPLFTMIPVGESPVSAAVLPLA